MKAFSNDFLEMTRTPWGACVESSSIDFSETLISFLNTLCFVRCVYVRNQAVIVFLALTSVSWSVISFSVGSAS